MSGSEIAMRIALCDLVERLKRSEQNCRYLERCRNELAKELIRVKQDNELWQREYTTLAASIESCEGVHECRNYLTNRNDHQNLPPATAISPGTSSLIAPPDYENKTNDENWEEISNRLLKELEKEVAKSKTNRRLVSHQSESINQSSENEDEATVTLGNNSVGSELLVANQPQQELSDTRHKMTWDVKDCSERNKDAANVKASLEGGLKPEEADVLYTLLKSFTVDANKVTSVITNSNEKLSKLRTRQLRNFFKRQLNEDTTKGNRCHLEHV